MGHVEKQAKVKPDIAKFPVYTMDVPMLKGLDTVDLSPDKLDDPQQSLFGQVMGALQRKDTQEAIALVREHVKSHPKNADLYNLMGAFQLHQDEPAAAKISFKKADGLRPRDAKILNNLACVHMAMGAYADALSVLDGIQKYGTVTSAQIYYNRALCYFNMNQFPQVLAQLDWAEKYDTLPDVYILRARTHQAMVDIPTCEKILVTASEKFPTHDGVAYYLSGYLYTVGKLMEAFRIAADLMTRQPDNYYYAVLYASVCQNIRFDWYDPAHVRHIQHILRHKGVDVRSVETVWETFFKFSPGWSTYFADLSAFDLDSAARAIDTLKQQGQLVSEFVIDGLRSLVLRDVDCEIVFTQMRHVFLNRALAGGSFDENDLLFMSLLATQCYRNEYVYFVTPDEQEKIGRLKSEIDPQNPDISVLLVLCLYAPITDVLPPLQAYTLKDNPFFIDIVQEQVSDKRREFDLMKQIPKLTPIQNDVSLAVEQMYVENPYPLWRHANYSGSMAFLNLSPRKSDRAHTLIAGCGTGKHSIDSSLAFQNTDVLAIDLSRRSLAYAMRKTEEMGLTHIRYAQADILELGSLQERFDVIESVGVLHHLAEPEAGLRVLLGLLKPGGFFRFGLYSELARRAVVVARDIVANGNYPATPEGIRAFRHGVITARGDHPAAGVLKQRDFFSMATCRDLVFHIQETRYTIPQLKKMLLDHGLIFRFFSVDPVQLKAFQEMFPAPEEEGNLDSWAEFEEKNPKTFAGMYQFWAQKPIS